MDLKKGVWVYKIPSNIATTLYNTAGWIQEQEE